MLFFLSTASLLRALQWVLVLNEIQSQEKHDKNKAEKEE